MPIDINVKKINQQVKSHTNKKDKRIDLTASTTKTVTAGVGKEH